MYGTCGTAMCAGSQSVYIHLNLLYKITQHNPCMYVYVCVCMCMGGEGCV